MNEQIQQTNNQKRISKIISRARKLVLVVKDGPNVQFPKNATINAWGANNTNPKAIAINETENPPTYQGAGVNDIIIVNEVPEQDAMNALRILEEIQGNDGIKTAQEYLISQGLGDQYTSNPNFLKDKLSAAGVTLDDGSGIYKRDDKDVTEVYKAKNDEYFVRIPNGEWRSITREILERTYVNVDGQPIDTSKITTIEE